MKNKFMKLSFLADIVGIILLCCTFFYVKSATNVYNVGEIEIAIIPDLVFVLLIAGLCLFLFSVIMGVISLKKERKQLSWVSISIGIIAILITLLFLVGLSWIEGQNDLLSYHWIMK